MSNKIENAKVWSEIIKNIFQVLAIFVGAIWTYNLFIRKEAPTLEPKATAISTFGWKEVENSDDCEATFRVGLTNIGTTPFDVTEVRIRGWKFQRDKLGEFASYLDIHEIQDEAELFFDKTYAEDASYEDSFMPPFYIEHYPPEHNYTHTFSWIITPDTEYWILFYIQFSAESNGKEYEWRSYSWSQVDCSN
jgi:hypothetical protein